MEELFGAQAPKLRGLKIVGKIDVSSYAEDKLKNIRPEKYNEVLDGFLAKMSAETNAVYPELLNPDGSINMDAAGYTFQDKEQDRQTIADCEVFFANKINKTVEEWREQRPKAPGVVTEKAITALLHKVLKDDFLVVRTSTFDDYRNGVDNLIIDKMTGSVVCGFDELKTVEERKQEKYAKISEKIATGGAFIKYGARIKAGELKRKPLRNLPAFLLSLDSDDLHLVLPDIGRDGLSTKELEIFTSLMASLETQFATLYLPVERSPQELEQDQKQSEADKKSLQEKFGAEEWSKTTAGREWKRRDNQVHLAANALRFRQSLEKIKNILAKLKS